MSNLVGQFIDETKAELSVLEQENPDLAIAVMQALTALAEYESVQPQRISEDQKQELENGIALLSLSVIDPTTKAVTPLTTEQQQALQNQGYNGKPESTTDDLDIDDIVGALNDIDIDQILGDINIDDLDEDLDDLLDSI